MRARMTLVPVYSSADDTALGSDVFTIGGASLRTDDERWKSRATAAMERYVDLYGSIVPRLHGYVVGQLAESPGHLLVEDLVQLALLGMVTEHAGLTRGAEVIPWAFATAHRLVGDLGRPRRR